MFSRVPFFRLWKGAPVPKLVDRNPESAPGNWYIDSHCIDCAASRGVASGLMIHSHGKSIFRRQLADAEEEFAAWRALLLCPTASVGTESHRAQPPDLFPQKLAPGLYRCGYNARSSFGAHSYFATRDEGNLLIDSPRYGNTLVRNSRTLAASPTSCRRIATMSAMRTVLPDISGTRLDPRRQSFRRAPCNELAAR